MENKKTLSSKLIIACIIPPAIVAAFACTAFSLVTTNIIHKHVVKTTESVIYYLQGNIQSIIQPNVEKMSNWQSILKEIRDEEPLTLVMKGISADLAEDTLFYFATATSRFERDGFFINNQNWAPDEDWVPNERPWYIAAEENSGRFTFTEPYIDFRTGKLCATFSQSVFDKNGKTFGVAAMDVMLDFLGDIVDSISVSENSNVHLILSDGRYLTNKSKEKVMSDNYFSEQTLKRLQKAGYSQSSFLDGDEKVIIQGSEFYATCRIGTSPWFIVIDGPVRDFSGHFKKAVFLISIALLILGSSSVFVNMHILGSMRNNEKSLASRLIAETQNLAHNSKQNARTSHDQSAAVKEIVATMEDCNALSEDISRKITDVSALTLKTNENVASGVDLIAGNVAQLHKIAEANMTTIDGIKELGDKITNIWDIVTLINSVADQAKIIAFNAELEAASAGEAGKNFHIVATEIRRLADGIIDGTKEIKSKIGEIEKSSDTLILMSENGTEKIASGVNRAKLLEDKFASVKSAAEITADSAEKITAIIKQQTSATEQILITLKQIASGVDKFTSATESISTASQNIKNIAEGLN